MSPWSPGRTVDLLERRDAYDVVSAGSAPVIVTCEHASARIPEPWSWQASDLHLYGTHWSYDIGAAELTRELAGALGSTALLARFSRLLVDANRPPSSPTLFLERAEGRSVALNAQLTPEDRGARLSRLYEPYHEAADRLVGAHPGAAVFSVHSFTPVYEGAPRQLEVGVLFDREEASAVRLAEALGELGLRVQLNEPYSGRDGQMFSPGRLADRHGRPALELEVRQDLAGSAAWRSRFVPRLAGALGRVFLA